MPKDNRDKELDNQDELDAQATGEELAQDIEPDEPEPEPEPIPEIDEPSSAPASPRPIRAPIPIMPALGRTGDILWGQPEQKPERPKSDMDDLFEVPQEDDNDMYTDDLFEVDEEDLDMDDDLSDLMTVSREDVMGKKPIPKSQRFRRTGRQYDSPTSMGGIG
jgi:hypothetical protein